MTLHAPQSMIPKSPSRRSVSRRRSSRRGQRDSDDDGGYSSGSHNESDYFSDNLEARGRAEGDDDVADEPRGRSSKRRFPSFPSSKAGFLSRRNGNGRGNGAPPSDASSSVNSHNRESFLASRRKDNLFRNYARRIGEGMRRRSLSLGRSGGGGDGESEFDSRGHAIQIRHDDDDDDDDNRDDSVVDRRPRDQQQYDGHFRYGHPEQQRYHDPNPFLLTSPRLVLSPRADLWMALAFTSCAAISSIAMARGLTARTRSSSGSALDKLALSVCALSFGISFVVAVGFRYGPLRGVLTRPVGDDGNSNSNFNFNSISNSNSNALPSGDGGGGGANHPHADPNSDSNMIFRFCKRYDLTPEVLVLSLLSLLWLMGIPIIADGSPPDGPEDLTLAVAGTDIWNANLFYSSWASCALVWYLLVEVVTLADRRGVLEKQEEPSGVGTDAEVENGGGGSKANGNNIYGNWNNNILSKRWSLLLLNSFVILSSSVNTYYGPMCQGMLSQTDYCQRGLVGIVVGGVFTELLILGVGVLFRLSHMTKKAPVPEDAESHPPQLVVPVVSKPTLHKACSLLSFVCLLFQSVNVALMTSPTGGGPATDSGTTYFASWVGFLLAFELGLRYLEWYTSAGSLVGGGGGHWVHRAERRSLDHPNALPATGENVKRLGAPVNSSDSSTQSSDDEETVGRRPVAVLKTNNPHDVKSEASLSNYGFSPPSVNERPGGHRTPRANNNNNNNNIKMNNHTNNGINKNEAVDPFPDFVSQTAAQGSLEPEAMSYQNLTQRSQYSRRSTGGAAPPAAKGGVDASANASQASRSTVQSWNPGDDQRSQQRSNKSSIDFNNPSGYISRQKSIHYNDIHVDDEDEQHSQLYYGAFTSQNVKAEELDQDPQISRSRNQSQSSSNNNANNSNNLSPLQENSNETSQTDSMMYNMMNNNDGIEIHPLKQPSNDGVDHKSSSSTKRRHSRKSSNGGESVKSSKSNRSSKSSSSRDKDGRRRRRSSSGHKKKSTAKVSGSTYNSPDSVDETVSSGSNPPPTIASEYSSQQAASRAASRTRSNASGTSGQGQQQQRGIPVPTMSSASTQGSRGAGNSSIANSSGPPPPPFQRSPGSYPNEDMDVSSQFSDYLNSIPMASINTNNKSPTDSDTVVSDPTIDPHFDPPAPAANSSAGGVPRSTGSGNTSRRKNTTAAAVGGSGAAASATGSHSTSSSHYHRTSSDENPSSGADHEQVDDIVKAALAYAEQTHGDEGVERSSSAFENSGFNQESIHSFYSGSNKRMPPPSSGSGSKNNRSRGSHASEDVNNLVKQALSQAGHGNRHFQPPARPQNTMQKSLYDTKSVNSMYSETTEFTDQEAGQHFDC